jgi:hypothetical protein
MHADEHTTKLLKVYQIYRVRVENSQYQSNEKIACLLDLSNVASLYRNVLKDRNRIYVPLLPLC